MKTLNITQTEALRLYPGASGDFKKLLEETFGDVLKVDITDRVKTFEDACAALGLDPATVMSENDAPDEAAYKKLKIIAKALNQGWTPDWDNEDEYKYYPWFNMEGGFSFSGVDDCDCADSNAGSRLCFRTSALAEYAGKQFLDIYKEFFTIQ